MLKGKVILVTGATSGIGRVTAVECAKEGAKVMCTGRRVPRLEKVVKEIENSGGEATYQKVDVSIEKEVSDAVDACMVKWGRFDGAFNNSGIVPPAACPIWEVDVEQFTNVHNVNVKGVFFCLKHEMRAIKAAGNGGSIVNNSSIAGQAGMTTGSVYVSSKHAVEGLMLCASKEGGKFGIRVNSVMPGPIVTDIWNILSHTQGKGTQDAVDVSDNAVKALETMGSVSSLERPGVCAEVARPVVFLLSDQASYITGASIPIDGGILRLLPDFWKDF